MKAFEEWWDEGIKEKVTTFVQAGQTLDTRYLAVKQICYQGWQASAQHQKEKDAGTCKEECFCEGTEFEGKCGPCVLAQKIREQEDE